MIRNELKIKYKNSVLGFAWSLLNPLLYLVVFYIAFVKILGSGIPAFPIWLLSGLLVWNLFSTGLGAATGSVVANSGLVKKVVVPARDPSARRGRQHARALLPAEPRCCSSCSRSCSWDVAWAYIPLLPLALLALLLLTGALGILLSAINVYLRDTQHFLELALLAWFWVTPIVYAFQTIGRRARRLVRSTSWLANPVTPIVLIFQRAIYAELDNPNDPVGPNPAPDPPALAVLGGTSRTSATRSRSGSSCSRSRSRVFGRVEANFAEEL